MHTTDRRPVSAAPTTSWFAPTDVPGGLELVGVETNPEASGTGQTVQLFGRVDDTGAPSPAVLLRIQPSTGGTSVGAALTVRGLPGVAAAPKEAVGATERISWTEAGGAVDAVTRGMSRDEALAVLASLHLRTANALDGFDAGTLPVLGEQLVTAGPSGVRTTFDYAPAGFSGGEPPLHVDTSQHATYPGYLGLWIQGTRGADGSVVVHDPGWGLDLAFPDGRQILVYSKTDDWPVLERIARSVKVLSPDATASLAAAAVRDVADRPTLAAADSAGMHATLHGVGTPSALCVAVADATSCGSPATADAGANGPYLVSMLHDGTWRVVVASTTPVRITADGRGSPDLATHVEGGPYDFAFVSPPASVTNVIVQAGPDDLEGTGIARPPG